jgi:tetratricopeptide (TPR) repeat protein
MKKLLFLILVMGSFSQGTKKVRQPFSAVIEKHIFNYDFEKATDTLEIARSNLPKENYGLYQSFIYFYQYFSVQGAERQPKLLDSLIAVTERVTKNHDKIMESNDSNRMLMLGGCLGFEGIAHFLKKNYFSALTSAYSAQDVLFELHEQFPNEIDPLLGVGIYNYALSKPPRMLRAFLSILGYSGDKELGFKYLDLVAEKGYETKIQSSMFLISHSLYEEKYFEETYSRFDKIPEEFRQLPMYLARKIIFEYYLKKYDLVVQNSEKISPDIKAPYIYNKVQMFKARSLAKLGRFDESLALLNKLRYGKYIFKGGFYYELRESYGDLFFEKKEYLKAKSHYEFIYKRTSVDKRKERVEEKLEKLDKFLK